MPFKISRNKHKESLDKEGPLVGLIMNALKEISPEHHPNFDPRSIYLYSTKKLTWRCGRGHIWQSSLYSRIHRKAACPACRVEVFREKNA